MFKSKGKHFSLSSCKIVVYLSVCHSVAGERQICPKFALVWPVLIKSVGIWTFRVLIGSPEFGFDCLIESSERIWTDLIWCIWACISSSVLQSDQKSLCVVCVNFFLSERIITKNKVLSVETDVSIIMIIILHREYAFFVHSLGIFMALSWRLFSCICDGRYED